MSQERHDPSDRRPIKARGSWWARAVARGLATGGVSPNAISVFGMLAAVAAGVAFYFTRYQWGIERGLWTGGVALVVLRLLANMFDGMVAVEWGKASRIGELYNEVPDRISDAAVLIGAGYADGGSLALGYAAACVALFVAYVRSVGKAAGVPSDFRGPMAKQQRMLTVVVAAMYMAVTPTVWRFGWGPQQAWGIMAVALLVVVVGGVLTAGRRLRRAAEVLQDSSP